MRDVTVATLLTAAVGVELLCCVGVLVMNDVFDRLHYLGPASAVGPFLVAGAVLVEESLVQPFVKATLVAILIAISGPVLSHATARAARVRQFDHWSALPAVMVEEDR